MPLYTADSAGLTMWEDDTIEGEYSVVEDWRETHRDRLGYLLGEDIEDDGWITVHGCTTT